MSNLEVYEAAEARHGSRAAEKLGFVDGARWQREELRTSESIEVVAVSLLHSDWPSDEADREYHWKHFADSYRERARAAIAAVVGEGTQTTE